MHLNKQAIDEREWDEGRNGGWGKDRRWRAASIGLLGSFILAQLMKKKQKKNEAKRPTISDKSKIKTSQVIIYCTRTRCLCERQYEKDLSFSTELNHNTDSCWWKDGGGGRGDEGDAEENKRSSSYLAGLSGALSAGVMWRDVWNRADNKREKWAPQEQRLEAEQLTIHSLHAVVAVPHSKHSPSVRRNGCWFHMAHLTKKRPCWCTHTEDKFLVSVVLLWRMMEKVMHWRVLWRFSSGGQMLPCKNWHGSAGMGLSGIECSTLMTKVGKSTASIAITFILG